MGTTLVVLAGGRSTRFPPVDKALAPVEGRPMLGAVVDELDPVVDEVVVNCRQDQRAAFATAVDARFAVDPVPDEGPVAGLRTALRAVSTPYALVVGCDMPRFEAGLARRLREAATGAVGAAPVVAGRRHPLGVVYRVADARRAAERTLARGDDRLTEVLARVDPVGVPAPDRAVRDVDTPAALAALTGEGRAREEVSSDD